MLSENIALDHCIHSRGVSPIVLHTFVFSSLRNSFRIGSWTCAFTVSFSVLMLTQPFPDNLICLCEIPIQFIVRTQG